MIGEATNGFFHLKFCTMLVKTKHSVWNASMALSGNRQADGIDGRTNLGNCGGKPKWQRD